MIATITEDRMRQIAIALDHVYVDIDNAWGNQCWDSANYINSLFYLPQINTGGPGRWPGWAGNMVDAFPQTAEIAEAFELIAPDQPGLPGDTYVWSDANSEWFPSTHVATLVVDTGNGWPLFLSQNSSLGRPDIAGYSNKSSGPIILQNLPVEGLLGIIRPRTSGMGIITPASAIISTLEDAGMALTLEELQAIQGFVQTERETVIKEVRANAAATVNAVTDALDKAVWTVMTFDQSTDNENADRVIHDFRAQLAAAVHQFEKEREVSPNE